MKLMSYLISRGVVTVLLFLCVAAARSAEVTIRWVGTIQNTDIRFEGQFSFPTDDPAATSIIDLLTVGTSTDVVVSDGITSQTWNYNVAAPPNDLLPFLYCPGGESQCAIPAPGAFNPAFLPSWTGTPLQTDCGAFTPAPCLVQVMTFVGSDPPIARVNTDIGLATANFTFEIVSILPECDIQLNQLTYVDGDMVTADVFRIANPTAASLALEWKVWLAVPGLSPIGIVNLGADGSFVLPAGTDVDLGPLPLLPVSAALPRGNYELSCRMLDPVTGELLTEDLNPFEITGVMPLVTIDVTPTNPMVTAGSTLQFAATGNYSDGSTQDITTEVVWGSSFPSMITVSNNTGSEGLGSIISVAAAAIVALDPATGIVGRTTIVDTAGYYLDLTNANLNSSGTSVATAPNSNVTLTVDYTIWNRSGCPGCIDWIAVGIEGDGQEAFNVGIPGTFPGGSGSASFTLTAPGTSGTYKVYAFLAPDFTEPDALSRYELNFPDGGLILIGTITVQ